MPVSEKPKVSPWSSPTESPSSSAPGRPQHLNQNRVFVGVKQGLGRSWSFDLGYMLEAFAADAPPEVAAAGPQPAVSKLAGAAR